MRTVVLGDRPAELEALIERRRAIGADLYDEVWEGEYHLAPAPRITHAMVDARIAVLLARLAPVRLIGVGPFNLGDIDDYRVPDRGLLRPGHHGVYASTAALVVEILSADDETWSKLPFYAAHHVDEVVVVDPAERTLTWMVRDGAGYRRVERSELLGVDVDALAAQIDWPPDE